MRSCMLGRWGCIYVGLWDCKAGPADILRAGRWAGISDKSQLCGPESNIARTGQQAGDAGGFLHRTVQPGALLPPENLTQALLLRP